MTKLSRLVLGDGRAVISEDSHSMGILVAELQYQVRLVLTRKLNTNFIYKGKLLAYIDHNVQLVQLVQRLQACWTY